MTNGCIIRMAQRTDERPKIEDLAELSLEVHSSSSEKVRELR